MGMRWGGSESAPGADPLQAYNGEHLLMVAGDRMEVMKSPEAGIWRADDVQNHQT